MARARRQRGNTGKIGRPSAAGEKSGLSRARATPFTFLSDGTEKGRQKAFSKARAYPKPATTWAHLISGLAEGRARLALLVVTLEDRRSPSWARRSTSSGFSISWLRVGPASPRIQNAERNKESRAAPRRRGVRVAPNASKYYARREFDQTNTHPHTPRPGRTSSRMWRPPIN